MRIALISDNHANLAATEAVVDAAQRAGASRLLVAGDVLSTGPDPVATVACLIAAGATMIRGNNDDELVDCYRGAIPAGWQKGLQWAPRRWSAQRLDSDTVDYVASLPEQRTIQIPGTASIRLVHGSPRHIGEPLMPDPPHPSGRLYRRVGMSMYRHRPRLASEAVTEIDEPVLATGHTHIAYTQRTGGRLVVNGGAVGMPVNDDGFAEWALLTWKDGRWEAALQRTDYGATKTIKRYQELGYAEAAGPIGRLFMHEVATGHCGILHFLRHARRVAQHMGCDADGHLPDEVILRAEHTFCWPESYGGRPGAVALELRSNSVAPGVHDSGATPATEPPAISTAC